MNEDTSSPSSGQYIRNNNAVDQSHSHSNVLSSKSEDNILTPTSRKRISTKKSFMELLDSVTDIDSDPTKLKMIQLQKKKNHIARSMIELKHRRVLPMLMRRKQVLKLRKDDGPSQG